MKVLIVDDEPDLIETLIPRLKSLVSGLELASARDGVEALERLPSFKPDLLLIDLSMPRMDGWQLASRLAGTPFVIMTAWVTEDLHERALAAGALGLLRKPFTDREIVGALGRRSHENEEQERG